MDTQMTPQEKAWSAQVGQDYTDRNTLDASELDDLYTDCFGITRWELNEQFLNGIPKTAKILEVGCNIGMQLRHLQLQGYTNLHGIELQQYAIDRLCVENVTVRQGSAYALPYEDGEFDLVFTSGVLIHLPAHMLPNAIREIVRVSKRTIWGFEYYAAKREKIADRHWENMLWADDFPAYFLWRNNVGLRLVRRWSEIYHEILEGTVADMYLLEKI